MFFKRKKEEKSTGISKTTLLLGAAGLLLFIVGVKRTYRMDTEGTTLEDLPTSLDDAAQEAGSGDESDQHEGRDAEQAAS